MTAVTLHGPTTFTCIHVFHSIQISEVKSQDFIASLNFANFKNIAFEYNEDYDVSALHNHITTNNNS